MKSFILDYIVANVNLFKSAYQVSKFGVKNRFMVGIVELIPQLLFYAAQFVVVFAMFSVIDGNIVDKMELVTFFVIMIAIDSIGDALLFKGIQEYIKNIRRGQTLYYILTPGLTLFKVLFYRWDFPMLILGIIFFVAANMIGGFYYHVSPIYISITLIVGIMAHIVLTGAFHIIQAYYDPRMPIHLGSPASRLYTKPMHLFLTGGIAFSVMSTLYPAYFITSLPSIVTTNFSGVIEWSLLYVYVVGVICIGLWMAGLNFIIKKTCKERQG
ncbi:hypothetical protein [Chengkuizengella axinellae]|uniref:ABC transporter permease n=1 Tax=Chengkuizengella axinellae TaxID=3064388 RepID=A0ABT9IZN9_9BACL|nr:hypothetical protein [Chengkuizengella sp. 2205SS18-9]MDP5274841.1 hypothetical protein [Chengkuizengella sp. 2205SS18-9]